MFGRMNQVLLSACDSGMSQCDTKTILLAIQCSGRLSAMTFKAFKPDQSNRIHATINADANMGDVLLTVLDPDQGAKDNKVLACKHSGHGAGLSINLSKDVVFRKENEQGEAIEGIFGNNVSVLFCFLFCYFLLTFLSVNQVSQKWPK